MSYMVNPLPPISDQDRVLLYNDNTVSSRWLVRIKKSIRRESLVYPVQNSSNLLQLCSRQEGELQNKWNLGSGRGETCKTIQIEVDKGKDWEKNQNVILTICIINFWWKEEYLGFVLVNPLSGWILSHVIHRLYLMMQLNSLVRWHKTRLSIRKLSKAL